ncbi:MAG: hypothetical protein GY854_09390 [Deltaproteobacteria bacterium]|nr:hypothetical protein [Deltaproteobacteria bacterium]
MPAKKKWKLQGNSVRPVFRVLAGIISAGLLAPFVVLPIIGDDTFFNNKELAISVIFTGVLFACAAIFGKVPTWMMGVQDD